MHVFTLIGLTLSLSAIITTIPIPAIYAGGGDNDENNKQKVEMPLLLGIADCDWNDVKIVSILQR